MGLVVVCEHPMPQNFPFLVLDFLMNLLSLRSLCLMLVIICTESSNKILSSKLNIKRLLDLFWRSHPNFKKYHNSLRLIILKIVVY